MSAYTIAAALVLAATAALPAAAAEWQGQVVEEDGVRVVRNPEEPVARERIEYRELWNRGGEDDEILFGVVSQLVEDGEGNIYLLDGQLSEVQVFSPDGDHLRTIGREGEGPGEFRNASDMYLGPGGLLGVLQIFPGKIVQLEPDGSPAGNFPLPQSEGGGFQLIFVARGTSDRVVLAGAEQRNEGGKQTQITYLKAYDPEGREIVHFHDEASEMRFGGMKFQEAAFSNFSRRWTLREGGRTAAALDFHRYRIHVWNPDGTVNHVIERPDYVPVERTPDEMERFQKLYDGITRWNPNSTFTVSPTHPAVGQLWYRKDGSLWVLSSRGRGTGDGVFASIDVYDDAGRYLKQVDLVLEGDSTEDGIFFADERLYRVTDLFSAFMSTVGGDVSGEVAEEPEPVRVIAYTR